MKTIITEQLISHDVNGVPKGLIVTQATFDANGQFLANQRHELTTLTTQQIAEISEQISELSADKDRLEKKIVKDQSDFDSQLEAANTTIATLTSQIATLQESLEGLPALQAQLAEALELVEEYRPYDTNMIRSKAFYDRISGDERFQLGVLAMTDDNAKEILALLNSYLLNPTWEVLLNDPKVVGAFQYLQAVGMLTPERVAELHRPATKEEAYITP